MSFVVAEVPNPLSRIHFLLNGQACGNRNAFHMEPGSHGQFELHSLKPLNSLSPRHWVFLFSFSFLTTIWYFLTTLRLWNWKELPTQANWCHYKLTEVCLPLSLDFFTCSRSTLSLITLSCLSKPFPSLPKSPSQFLFLLFSGNDSRQISWEHCLHSLSIFSPSPCPGVISGFITHENSWCFLST